MTKLEEARETLKKELGYIYFSGPDRPLAIAEALEAFVRAIVTESSRLSFPESAELMALASLKMVPCLHCSMPSTYCHSPKGDFACDLHKEVGQEVEPLWAVSARRFRELLTKHWPTKASHECICKIDKGERFAHGVCFAFHETKAVGIVYPDGHTVRGDFVGNPIKTSDTGRWLAKGYYWIVLKGVKEIAEFRAGKWHFSDRVCCEDSSAIKIIEGPLKPPEDL